MRFDFADAGRDVAAQRHDLQIGAQETHLRDAAQARGPHARAGRQIGQRRPTDQRFPGIVAPRNRGEREAVGGGGGQILERVHGNVDPAIEQRLFDFLGEEPFALELVQRAVHLGVSSRLDDDELRGNAPLREPRTDPVCLPAREPAAARSDLHANLLTSDSTRPGTVWGSASITSGSPSSRAVAAVIGPMAAATKPPEVEVSEPTSRTKLRTVEDEVKVTASMRPAPISETRPAASS